MTKCPSENTAIIDQSSFWSPHGVHWDAHRIGWLVSGVFTIVTILISIISIGLHCRNYTNRRHQRQILRILYMPPVYSIISFFSYRYFRSYTYYSFIQVGDLRGHYSQCFPVRPLHPCGSGFPLTMSLHPSLLLIEFVADVKQGDHEHIMANKEKRRLVIPPYFMYAVKWSVLQYVVVRPAVSLIGIICEAFGVLCETQGFNVHYANAYLESIDFVSISIALYGLILFYELTKEELKGRRPLAKFLAIKLIVMFTFYQGFIFTAMEGRVIHATEFWTETNIANGLDALTICIEMMFFAIFMWWAYPSKEYRRSPGTPATSVWRALLDSINLSDFVFETIQSSRYLFQSQKRSARVPAPRTYRRESIEKIDFGTPVGDPSDQAVHLAPLRKVAHGYKEDIPLSIYKSNDTVHSDSSLFGTNYYAKPDGSS
ncbi:uncharacterized protein LACBIDRAFT_296311 [Laccaria bicolor S238N-H82]|uniref:Predicted protein n=1 Tax=Laccaria bicolor (strain S238N-H82 / ATCC MYA-4686) TaxID=486041 RepID=B0D8H4_LACBS|nr:uncharacterized protein LACBIDRAFT_296311 [Laccaria bicolor S238N-H82]EDR09079.1 predicted protein [Laccaria bicolor S238N-H82]|eukprot:XP_001880392.1 predicted protein [Laccaria bicolor S238N-H82]